NRGEGVVSVPKSGVDRRSRLDVARTAARATADTNVRSAANSSRNEISGSPASYDEDMAGDVGAALTLRQLEDHLWQAADLFRNKVSNQKDYILALLFFKRASDIYKEETEAALVELAGLEDAAEIARDVAFHVLQVPDGHSWNDVRDTDEALMGKALNDALAAIGRANPKQLSGVFERTDFNNKMALPADDLRRIVDHFHALGPLTKARVPADMLGKAYEWLIAKFAAAAG